MDVLDTIFYGNTLATWLTAAATALIVFVVLSIVRRLILRYIERLAGRTRTHVDDVFAHVLARTKVFFVAFLSLYAGSRVLVLPPGIQFAIKVVGVTIVCFQLGLWGNSLIEGTVRRHIEKTGEDRPATATTVTALGFLGRLILWTVLLLLALANLGIQVGPLLAGLGVGGIAVALAVQNILGDLFASLSIVLDKPFVIGDYIAVGTDAGTVEHIGLKTTRVRSLTGEQLIFSNSDLLASRVRNYRRMMERRVTFTIGVIYATPRPLLVEIPGVIREIIEGHEKARFDRAHFKAFGPSSLDFEVVYWVMDSDFKVHMDILQAINLAIHERFEAAGIEFAYPTQTVILEGAAVRAPT
jgi:small-conductance mechanosensitive channel